MEIILLSDSRGRVGRLAFTRPVLAVVMIVLVVSCTLLVQNVFEVGAELAAEQILRDSDSTAHVLQRELLKQKAHTRSLEADFGRHINALASRLGSLQAHVTRLDAMGERLTRVGGLSEQEFNFGADPAIGGPVSQLPQSSQSALDIAEDIERLAAALREQQDKLAGLESVIMSAKMQAAVEPAGRPVVEGWMSSPFGTRSDPVTGKREFHRGIDFAGRSGSPIVSVAAGVVQFSGRKSGHGNMVEINHGNGLVTRYSHNKENLVTTGDKVSKNQIIAKMGSTGRSTGPHVHFEVMRDGKFVNPLRYIRTAKK